MKLTLSPYKLHFKFPFRIAHGSRSQTNVVYLKLEHEGFTAWGEAALPPYLPETQESVIAFLLAIDSSAFKIPLMPGEIFDKINATYPGHRAAKAALDMALWSLKSKMENKSLGELLGVPQTNFPKCTYTTGVCDYNEMKLKINTAHQLGFEIFKIKFDGEKDDEVIENFRKLSNKPFMVDVNQGWKNTEEAREKMHRLKSMGCLLIEQPLPVTMDKQVLDLSKNSDLPIYADESCQSIDDLNRLYKSFSGVNIKLMKCGGISAANKMIKRAKELNLSILIGCMSESSVGCTAAAYLSPLADYADLDGPYLIDNDPFTGMKVEMGRIQINPLKQKIKI